MNDEIFLKIKRFITEQGFGYTLPFPLLFKKKEITRDMCLERDLGITGDDADEFLIDFAKEFNVNVANFAIGDYFNDEGDKLISSTFRAITGKKEKQRKELTVGHLEKAVIAGRLDEETINS